MQPLSSRPVAGLRTAVVLVALWLTAVAGQARAAVTVEADTRLAPEVVERLIGSPDLAVEKVLGRPWPYGWREQVRLLD